MDVTFQEVIKLFAWTKAIFVVYQDLLDALLTQYIGCLLSFIDTLHDILEDLRAASPAGSCGKGASNVDIGML